MPTSTALEPSAVSSEMTEIILKSMHFCDCGYTSWPSQHQSADHHALVSPHLTTSGKVSTCFHSAARCHRIVQSLIGPFVRHVGLFVDQCIGRFPEAGAHEVVPLPFPAIICTGSLRNEANCDQQVAFHADAVATV